MIAIKSMTVKLEDGKLWLSYTEDKETVIPSMSHLDLLSKAKELLVFLNEKTGKTYKDVSANTSLIVARLKEYELDDLKSMVALKCREWRGGTMEQYLRPATLFNATKCAQYMAQLEVFNDNSKLPGL